MANTEDLKSSESKALTGSSPVSGISKELYIAIIALAHRAYWYGEETNDFNMDYFLEVPEIIGIIKNIIRIIKDESKSNEKNS